MCIDIEPLYGKARCYLRDKANELSPILRAIALYYDWPLPLSFADDRGNYRKLFPYSGPPGEGIILE